MRRLLFISVVLLFFPTGVPATPNTVDSYGVIGYSGPDIYDSKLDSDSSRYVSGIMNINDVVHAELEDKVTNSSFSPAPEPATMILLGSGLIALGWIGRKKLFKGNRP